MTYIEENLTHSSLSWISLLALLHLCIFYLKSIGLRKLETEEEQHDSSFLTNREQYPIYPKQWTYILFLFLPKVSLPKPSNHKLERQLRGSSTHCCCRGPGLCYQHPHNFSSRGSSTIALYIFLQVVHRNLSKYSGVLTQTHKHTCTQTKLKKRIRTSSSYLTPLHKLLTLTVLWGGHLLITSLPCHLAFLKRRSCKHSELKPTSFHLHLPSCCWHSVWRFPLSL